MPSSFAWRDKKKNNKEKANKDAFKKWYEGKRKAKEMKGKPKPERARDAGKAGSKGGKGRGKGADAQGPARLKGMGRGAGAGLGQSFGTATGSFGAPASADKPPEGVSAGLLERLLATKRRLLNGGEETGRGGEASEEQAASGDAFSRRGKGKGDGKSKGKGDEKGKGKGKGKKRGWEEDDTGAPAAKKARPAALWLAPPQDVNREERVALNRKIAEHGQVKNLAGTRAVLADLEERGWANGHTYANAVNALCRCGDWQGAFAALKRAEGASLLKRGAGLTSGVIARTAMLRGFCEGARDLGRAKALLERMERMELVEARPNTRTANTFLRGCLLLGAVGEAESLLSRIENEWTKDDEWRDRHGCSPDASSYEMVALLLCQALRYEDASKVAKRALKQLGQSPGSAGMFVAVARAAAVRGDAEAARAACKRASELLAQEEKEAAAASAAGGVGATASGSGGKRGTAKAQVLEDGGVGAARAKSLEVFQTHRRGELAAELAEVENCLSGGSGKKAKKKAQGASSSTAAVAVDLPSLWARTVTFDDYVQVGGSGAGGAEDPTTTKGAAKAINRRLCERFGLAAQSADAAAVLKIHEAALRAQAPRAKKGDRRKRKRKAAASKDDDASAAAAASGPVLAQLDLHALFPAYEGKQRPVHLELCSGGGEWLCAQALLEPSVSWTACELRFDRSARCLQRMALQGLARADGNVGLIAGDACEALQRRLLPGSVDRLFVNHPEPPHQTDLAAAVGDAAADDDGDEAADGAGEEKPAADGEAAGASSAAPHLLTAAFLRDGCGAALRAGGTLTICTDSRDYGVWLLRTLASAPLAAVFEDALRGTKADKQGRIERSGALALRSSPPPRELCGAEYTGEAGASYFQRLKLQEKSSRQQAQEEERYFLCLRRREA
eukprot:TRINITY_DN3174_c0_g1_i1.p1 TRINITY_DN3174_c0_g1~~TRINITY_DN3174_c0_g1_i1.p1  ORF type:complete len:905 (+),score=270.73 TRINITY_DN3174_c0_g1_i1:73-2787(+)